MASPGTNLDVSLEQGTGGMATTKISNLRLWQVANLLAIAVKFIVGFIPRERPAPLALVTYITPFFVAFFIWIVIHVGEISWSIWQLLQKPGDAPLARLAAIRAASPGWIAAHVFTGAFSLTDATWLQGVELTAVAVSLSISHFAVMSSKENPDFLVMNVPITMHFGWVTAAALLTWNVCAAETTSVTAVKLAVAIVSFLVALAVGGVLAFRRRSPVLSGTVAWAVFWIGVQSLTSSALAKELGAVLARGLGVVEVALACVLVTLAFKLRGAAARIEGLEVPLES